MRYIREHRKVFYTNLLTSGKLQSYLSEVETQAQELFDRLMKQRAEREGITEKLKADNQMEWIGRMNALRSAVTETVNAEVIFVCESGNITFFAVDYEKGLLVMCANPVFVDEPNCCVLVKVGG